MSEDNDSEWGCKIGLISIIEGRFLIIDCK